MTGGKLGSRSGSGRRVHNGRPSVDSAGAAPNGTIKRLLFDTFQYCSWLIAYYMLSILDVLIRPFVWSCPAPRKATNAGPNELLRA